MAFSKSLQKGQIPIGCQLCDEGSKIQWKCCDCDLLMCTKCKEKVHSKLNYGYNHTVIDIKEVGQQNSGENITFSDTYCKQHADQTCCLFCKTCKKLICFKCVTNTHNGHNLVDKEEFGSKREKVRETKMIVDHKLNHLAKMKAEISKLKKSEYLKYNKTKRDIHAQNKIIEKFVKDLLNELDDKWIKVNQDLKEKQNEVDKMEKVLQEQNTTIDELARSKDFMKFFEESDNIELSLVKNIEINSKYSSMPKFVPGEVTRNLIGTLMTEITPVEQETKTEFKVVRQFTSDLQNIHLTKVCFDSSLWICDSHKDLLQHIQFNENNIKELLRINTKVYDIAVTPGDALLICGESTVKQLCWTGEMKDTPYNVAPLVPRAIHVTSSNQVVIGARTPGKPFHATGRRVVIVMDQKGKHLVEYRMDRNNKPLFTIPRIITSTSDGNIFVVDWLDSDCRGRVVVLSTSGDVVSTYSGHSGINNKIPFTPTDVSTTTVNTIVVVDLNSRTIHILDSEGHFITYYSAYDIGIIYPCSIAVSTTGNFFICSSSLVQNADTFNCKLYEVELV